MRRSLEEACFVTFQTDFVSCDFIWLASSQDFMPLPAGGDLEVGMGFVIAPFGVVPSDFLQLQVKIKQQARNNAAQYP